MEKQAGLIRNSFKVFLQDVKNLFHAPAALIVALALLVLPSLYTWYNVLGFWDPYGNTGNLSVCVVNEDVGGSSEFTGNIDIGDMVVEKLKENDQLKWQFVDRQTADEALYAGDSYAAFVIPQDFTERLLAMTEGSYDSPTITYITNEKAGPVSPKITDAGATALDETINSAFVSTVSTTAVDAIDAALVGEEGEVKRIKAVALSRIDDAADKMSAANEKLDTSSKSLDDAKAKVEDAISNASTLDEGLTEASKNAETLSKDLSQLQKELNDFSNSSWPLMSSAISSISKASKDSTNATQTITSQITQASAFIDSSKGQAEAAVNQAKSASGDLRNVANALPDNSPAKSRILQACNTIDTRCASVESTIKDIDTASSNIAVSQEKINNAAKDNDAAVQKLTEAMQGATNSFFGQTLPAINSNIALINAALSSINASIPAQKTLIGELQVVLKELQSALATSKEVVEVTKESIQEFDTDLKDLRTDAAALLSSGAIANMVGVENLDAQRIAEFMGAPTQVETEKMFSPSSYGAAMAPLFMNLTFWIGAFMLIVIIRQEVNYPKIKGLTAAQSYLGRFLLFACMAVLQAVICCIGLLAIGVEAANVAALIFAASMTSLSYLSIIYALSLTLQHVGKGICLLLIFAQIPGATGLYPVEMTSGFFRVIYPFMPFTYGIDAMRESICGFYGSAYLIDVAMLLLFFFIATILGMAVRPLLANVSRMVSLQVRKSGIYNGEKTMIPPRPFRFSQIVKMLVDKDEYRAKLETRYKKFAKWYPRIIKGSIILGIVVPLGLVAVFALTSSEKVILLTIWLLFLLCLFVMLVVVENLRNNFKRQLRLDGVSDETILRIFGKKGEGSNVDTHKKVNLIPIRDRNEILREMAPVVRYVPLNNYDYEEGETEEAQGFEDDDLKEPSDGEESSDA